MNVKTAYQERFRRFTDVVAGKIPDRVPVLPNIETWMFHHTGANIKRAFLEDGNELFGAFEKLNRELYMDGVLSISNTIPVKMGQELGSGLYRVSEMGVQIVGSKGNMMPHEEYGALSRNPLEFFANVLTPRKFPVFSEGLDKSVELIRNSFRLLGEFNAYNGAVIKRIEEELGLPVLVKSTNYLAPDIVLDYLRDFVGISQDIRRRPEELLEACNSIFDLVLELFYDTCTPPDGRVLFSPLHLPTYLRPKDFEKLYFPFMERYVQELGVKRGYQLYFFMENDWMPYLDILRGLPEGPGLIGLFEHGDYPLIKEKLGSRMIFMGGMPLSVLSRGTKAQVIDRAKECLDTLAPGGKYIFSTDKVLMSPNDARAENLIAACEYIHLNGKYQ